MTKKKKRDPNIPVLAFKSEHLTVEVLVAGKGEFIKCAYRDSGYWTENSIVVREHTPSGLKETENDLHSPVVWGWIARLIAKVPGIILLSKTDGEL